MSDANVLDGACPRCGFGLDAHILGADGGEDRYFCRDEAIERWGLAAVFAEIGSAGVSERAVWVWPVEPEPKPDDEPRQMQPWMNRYAEGAMPSAEADHLAAFVEPDGWTASARGWWNMVCWNGLSEAQQARLIEVGNLPLGYRPEGSCQRGAKVAIETDEDVAPGPRFYCLDCAIGYLALLKFGPVSP
jgi:hypothetical protein